MGRVKEAILELDRRLARHDGNHYSCGPCFELRMQMSETELAAFEYRPIGRIWVQISPLVGDVMWQTGGPLLDEHEDLWTRTRACLWLARNEAWRVYWPGDYRAERQLEETEYLYNEWGLGNRTRPRDHRDDVEGLLLMVPELRPAFEWQEWWRNSRNHARRTARWRNQGIH